MNNSLTLVMIFVYFVLLMSCAKNTNTNEDTYTRGSNCEYQEFSGVLTIDKVEHLKDEDGSKFKNIKGKFYVDDADAPKSLSPAEFSLQVDGREFPEITQGKKFKLEVKEKINGTCTPRMFEPPEKWQEIQKRY